MNLTHPMKCSFAVLCLAAATTAGRAGDLTSASSQTQFVRIYLERESGQIHLVDNRGQDTAVAKDPDYEAVSDPKLASNGRSAGWLVQMRVDANYPVPVGVAVWRGNRVIRKFGSSELPVIMVWSFFLDDKRVGYAAHGAHGPDVERSWYELHDVSTGKMLQT